MTFRYPDPRRVNNFLDTCAFDPKVEPAHSSAMEIRALIECDEVSGLLSHSNQKEVDHPNTPAEVKAAAGAMIFTVKVEETSQERARKGAILDVLAGEGNKEKYRADADHVFQAGKYGGYFITTDNRILGRREELAKLGGGWVVDPVEWLKIFNAV